MARSLSELAEVRWVTTRITSFDEKELGDIFARRGLPPPRLGLSAETALSWMTAVAYTDMMSISPRQWTQSPLVSGLLAPVPINEVIEAAPIVLIHRAAVPPTPAAEYFCDLIRTGVASKEFADVNPRLLAVEMVMLAQLKALKGWAVRGFERSEMFADHWQLVVSRLQRAPDLHSR